MAVSIALVLIIELNAYLLVDTGLKNNPPLKYLL